MTPDPDQCPEHAEDVAEAYILGTLTVEQAATFEDHYLGCDACATLLYQAADYADAMHAAAKRVRSEATEETTDYPRSA